MTNDSIVTSTSLTSALSLTETGTGKNIHFYLNRKASHNYQLPVTQVSNLEAQVSEII
jgi:hypothetical protein